MSQDQAMLLICISHIDHGREWVETDLKERLARAFEMSQSFWMTTDDDVRFRAAVGAVLLKSSPEEKALITESMKPLRMLAAALSGAEIDLSNIPDMEGLIPLMKMYNEAKDAMAKASGR